MGRRIDTDDLWSSKQVGRYLRLGLNDPTGAQGARAVSGYRRKYPDFPPPVIEEENAVFFLRQDVERWRRKHPERPRRAEP